MPLSLRRIFLLGTILFPLPHCISFAVAQAPLAYPSLPLPVSSLRLLTRNSGYIFDGTVLSVERIADNQTTGSDAVQITFRVQQAMAGTQNGQTLKIREWSGLWNSGPRYRVGERLLLFLYPASKLGFTSPVGGALGRFAVDSSGNVILDRERLSALLAEPPSSRPASQMEMQGQNRMNARAFALAIQRMAKELE
jgi:hypothetical protein